MNLFISLYQEENPNRLGELMYCFAENLKHPLIKRVFILNEGLNLKHPYQILIDEFPTFNDYFNYINAVTLKDDINIIANSDIYFDETLKEAEKIKDNECYAICRQGMPQNYWGGSQDVWVFRGKTRDIDGSFPIGMPGSDNRLAHMIFKAGYDIKNPMHSIKCWHKHEGDSHYAGRADELRVEKPYRIVIPCEL